MTMTVARWADLLLLAVGGLDLYAVATSRLSSCVRASAIQGVALGLVPLALWGRTTHSLGHLALFCAVTIGIKAVVIPLLLLRAIRITQVRREVEPFVSLHVSLLAAAALVGLSFLFARLLVLPRPAPSPLLVPMAFATLLIGLLVLVSRKKAVTQVVGYLLVENGVYLFGQTLAADLPFAVELGMLLDLLVGIFVMGITIHQISREFDDIDTDLLSSLKD